MFGFEGDKTSDKIGNFIKKGNLAMNGYDFAKNIFGMLVFIFVMLYLMFHGLPIYIGLFFILFIAAMIVLQVVQFKRISSVSLTQQSFVDAPAKNDFENTTIDADEKIILAVSGIMNTGFGLRGVEVLGVGEIEHPENAMIITDKNILLLYVPLAMGDKLMGMDAGMADWLLAKGDIENKLNEMLSSMSLEQIFRSYPKNYGIAITDLSKVESSNLQQKITFVAGDKKHSYSLRTKEDFEKLKELFINYPS